MLRGSRAGGVPGKLTLLHDGPAFVIRAEEPAALQVDGDSWGVTERSPSGTPPGAAHRGLSPQRDQPTAQARPPLRTASPNVPNATVL